MKQPRTIRIIRLMARLTKMILRDERFLIEDSLDELEQLGGMYIKFLQVVVVSLNHRDQADFLKLLTVYEQNQPDELDLASHLKKLGYRHTDKLTDIAATPFATGSFGQIYHARLKASGQAVIIKVLRPSVMRYLAYDLALLNVLSSVYSHVDREKMIDFRQVYREFRKTCWQETNYRREAAVAHRYWQLYADHPTLVIPQTYRELSTDKIIIQDYIDGLSLTEVLAEEAKGVQAGRAYVAAKIGSDLFEQLFTVGYELTKNAVMGEVFQADPHPGNIILLADDKVALIDFGMSSRLEKNRMALYELLVQYKAYYEGNLLIDDFAMAALKFLSPKLHAAMGEADKLLRPDRSGLDTTNMYDKLRHATKSVANEEYTTQMVELLLERRQIMKVLFFAVNKGNRFGFAFDLSSITMLKACQSYMSLIGQFDHEAQVFARMMDSVVSYASRNLHDIATGDMHPLKPAEALELLSTWFDRMARHDPWLMQEVTRGYRS